MGLPLRKRKRHPGRKKKDRKGFTLLEILLVMAIISSMYLIVSHYTGGVTGLFNRAKEVRANAELNQIYNATHQWVIDHGGTEWPADVNRGVPPGLEEYLGPGNWPDAPFNSVAEYDWDVFTGSDGKQAIQISIRFCPLGQPSQCQFPDLPWAANFDYHSSYYFCIQGKCRAHPGKPDNHPGHCMNCDN